MGSTGKFFTRRRILMKFGTKVRLKPSNDRREFELDRTRSKNNIAENLVALGHETHNSVLHICKWLTLDVEMFAFSILL